MQRSSEGTVGDALTSAGPTYQARCASEGTAGIDAGRDLRPSLARRVSMGRVQLIGKLLYWRNSLKFAKHSAVADRPRLFPGCGNSPGLSLWSEGNRAIGPGDRHGPKITSTNGKAGADPMVPHDPESSASSVSVAAPAGARPYRGPTSEESFPDQHGRLMALALAAGLVAGVASLLAGEEILRGYQSDLLPKLKIRPSAEDMQRWSSARLYSATLTFTTMGGFLGLTMGLAGGLAQRSVFAGVRAAILGLLLGAAAAGFMALVLVSIFFQKHDPQSGDLVLPLLTHGAIWSAVGAIGGLAFGLGLGGRGRWKATPVGGLVGAAAATVVYEIVGALAFATSKTDLPVSASITTRAMAQLLVAILSAVGAVLALRQSAKSEASRGSMPPRRQED